MKNKLTMWISEISLNGDKYFILIFILMMIFIGSYILYNSNNNYHSANPEYNCNPNYMGGCD